MASKGPRSKLDHETRAKRQKVSCGLLILESYLLPMLLQAVSVFFMNCVFYSILDRK